MVVAAPVEGTDNISFISFISSVCAVQVNEEGELGGRGAFSQLFHYGCPTVITAI